MEVFRYLKEQFLGARKPRASSEFHAISIILHQIYIDLRYQLFKRVYY